MTGAQILEMMPVPKPDHVDAPHRHHPEAVSFPYDITMAQIQKTVPSDRPSVAVNSVVVMLIVRC